MEKRNTMFDLHKAVSDVNEEKNLYYKTYKEKLKVMNDDLCENAFNIIYHRCPELLSEEYEMVNDAMKFSVISHVNSNTWHGDRPYFFHLLEVYEEGRNFSHLLKRFLMGQNKILHILSSCWTHDLIEDCGLTHNDVKNQTNEIIAEITYALSNLKGKSRKERAGKDYYSGIRNTSGASFVKICDRMANVKYSSMTKSSLFEKYKEEHGVFSSELETPEYFEMFQEIEGILYRN